MASSYQSSKFVINFYRGGSFVRNPLTYDFEILLKVDNVDLSSMDYAALDLDNGLSSMFKLNESNGSDSDLEDDLNYCFSEDDSDTASVDHFSDDEEEVFKIRTQKAAPKTRQKRFKMFDATFLLGYTMHWIGRNMLIRIVTKVLKIRIWLVISSQSMILLKVEVDETSDRLYYEVNNPRKLHAKCSIDSRERKCPFRLWASWMSKEKSFQNKTLIDEHACSTTYEYGTLITSNWIARNYAKKIMINPNIKIREIVDLILKKYKCKVSLSQARRGKIKALNQYQTCLEDHYEMLWSYASEILNSNPGVLCEKRMVTRVNWKVIPSGESKFEVRNGYEGMNGIDRWPSTEYTKPLPPIVNKMPGRPPHKIKEMHVKRMMGIKLCWEEKGQYVRGSKTTRGGGFARDGKTVNASGSSRGVMEKGLQLVKDDVEGVKDGLHQLKSLRQLMNMQVASQDPIDEPSPTVLTPAIPAPAHAPVISRESERIKHINYKKPLSPDTGLTKEDAML
ncbi:hypothetical protein Tco_0669960, partial [Tanacetum coccineum]